MAARNDCCAKIRGALCHCAQCHETFPSVRAFDAHQFVDYSSKKPVTCKTPQELRNMGLVLDSRNVWRTPEGVVSAATRVSRLNTARKVRNENIR